MRFPAAFSCLGLIHELARVSLAATDESSANLNLRHLLYSGVLAFGRQSECSE